MSKLGELDSRTKLRATLEVKRIARSGIDNVYDTVDDWKKTRKRLHKQKKDVTALDYKIEKLEEELEKIEEHVANMEHGSSLEGRCMGSSGPSGNDAG